MHEKTVFAYCSAECFSTSTRQKASLLEYNLKISRESTLGKHATFGKISTW